ncbi:hypothetical protein DM860_015077 [Cuscuta australis]|uniref:Uncharacterized protein n=1 Tax=Cuscuta australis TaxID=267555 RepID=A0A328DUQ8_9ASTE|nr:hypothetical protein DM860_015077 [Cuscuta australis]
MSPPVGAYVTVDAKSPEFHRCGSALLHSLRVAWDCCRCCSIRRLERIGDEAFSLDEVDQKARQFRAASNLTASDDAPRVDVNWLQND